MNALADARFAHATDADRTGFEIGWDHAHYRLVPPADHLHAGHPVRQGWEAGQAVFGLRTLRATPRLVNAVCALAAAASAEETPGTIL